MDEEDEEGRRWWWPKILVKAKYEKLIGGPHKKIEIEDVHWGEHKVYFSDIGSVDIHEMSLERLYEYYQEKR